jgi:hypothetical protein
MRQHLFRRVRLWAVVGVVALAACRVEVAPPLVDTIGPTATAMRAEVAQFATQVALAADTPGKRAEASFATNQSQYERWLAQIATMETQSLAVNPGPVNCGEILRRIAAMAQRPADRGPAALPVPAGSESVDCQTAMIRALRIAVVQMGEYQKHFCTITEPPQGRPAPASFARQLRSFERNCAVAFDSNRRGVRGLLSIGLEDAVATSETQGTLRAILRVQEVKRANQPR